MGASQHDRIQQVVQQRRLLTRNFFVHIRTIVALAVGDGALESVGEVAAGAQEVRPNEVYHVKIPALGISEALGAAVRMRKRQ
jgi:hypothetical protein